MPLQPEDVELPQAPPVFPCLESLTAIQKQEISSPTSFPVSGDTTIPPVTPEVPQQFLRDPQESLAPDSSSSSGGVVVVALPQIATPSQPQTQQPQVPLFPHPQEGVAQLERAVRELQAGGNTALRQVLEAAVAQQQLNSVLYSSTPSADSLQQHVQENMNSLRLGTADNSLSTQQQLQIQQQQQQQFQQHQQLQQHLQQQQQQVLGTMQIQQQLLLQPQDQQQLQQQQQQQIMENIQQQQQQLQQNQQQQVLNNIQLQDQQQQNQMLTNLQQHQLQQQQQQNQALSNLQQQQQQQLQEQVLENLQQHLQAELLQPQIHSPQVQQPVSLLQQAGDLLTIQTSFPTQPPSHTSPPQQLFQSPRTLAETQGSQQQVQAALLQNTLTVLTSGSLNSEQQSTGSTLYLSPNPQPQQQQQQQQLAFISSMETSNQPQSVAMFQNQPQAQLSQMQQQSTPMEQQQSPQQNQQPPPQLPMGQQGSLFQSISNHSQASSVSQSQLSQPQQTGLLLCTTDLSPQAIPPTILFSTQTQGPSPIGSISVGIPQPDPAEPMSFQDQSSSDNNASSTENQQQSLFQEQQPMQVGPSSSSIPSSQPVELFLPQTSLSRLQSGIGSQELNNQAQAPGTTIFVVQGGVGVVANPGQQPPEQLFQTTVGGNVAPPGQTNLFVFGIQNGKLI